MKTPNFCFQCFLWESENKNGKWWKCGGNYVILVKYGLLFSFHWRTAQAPTPTTHPIVTETAPPTAPSLHCHCHVAACFTERCTSLLHQMCIFSLPPYNLLCVFLFSFSLLLPFFSPFPLVVWVWVWWEGRSVQEKVFDEVEYEISFDLSDLGLRT